MLHFCIRGLLLMFGIYFSATANVAFKKSVSLNGLRFTKLQKISIFSDRSRLKKVPFDIRILLASDYSLFNEFNKIYNNDSYSAKKALSQYMSLLFNQVRTLFSDRGEVRILQRSIQLSLATPLVVTRPEDCPLASNQSKMLEAVQAIQQIEHWAGTYSNWLPRHDHLTFLTNLDVSHREDELAHGLAFVGTICSDKASIGLVENVGSMATAVIIAHELAHSLGAMHDGRGLNSDCPTSDNYLMSPSVSADDSTKHFPNSFRLSQCSLNQIESYAKQRNGLRCLLKDGGGDQPVEAIEDGQGARDERPGERLGLNRQCRSAFGLHYRRCQNSFYQKADVCKRLWCKDATKGRLSQCETKSYLPALDGTPCSLNRDRWCYRGECRKNPKFDTSNMCSKGDLNRKMCTSLPASQLSKLCQSDLYMDICCATCAIKRKLLFQFK